MRKYTYVSSLKHDTDFETTSNGGQYSIDYIISQPIRKKSIAQIMFHIFFVQESANLNTDTIKQHASNNNGDCFQGVVSNKFLTKARVRNGTVIYHGQKSHRCLCNSFFRFTMTQT